MPIEGLNNTYGIPPVKKERGPGTDKHKKKKNKSDAGKKKENEKKKDNEGRIDIRI